ncbi:MAG: OsmC family protein [Chloroflexi bacterium]|nr:OsmC family protein [Chloroflexota bacterium]
MSIAESVARASAYLTEHPDEARYRDSAATARIVDGLVVDVTGPTGERLRTDMPAGIGGTASAPSPGWFLRAAIASCVASLIVVRAAATGVEIGAVEVEVDSESDDRGILGLDPTIPAGALSARIAVRLSAPALADESRAELLNWAVAHCPVSDSVARVVPMSVEVR